MVTLWLIGTWVAMATCLKPKSVWGEGFQQRRRVMGTICTGVTLPRILCVPFSVSPSGCVGASLGPSPELLGSGPWWCRTCAEGLLVSV